MYITSIARNSKAILAAAAFSLSMLVAAPAHAVDPTNTTATGGTLDITSVTVADFAGVTLDGTAKTDTAAMSAFSATDARGTGAGWNVTVGATRFAEYAAGAYVTGGKMLPVSSLSMLAPTVAANGTTSASPTITGGPYALDSGSAVKIASAAIDAGMGKYDFTQAGALTLSTPASTYARTYRSDVTVSVISGP